ncbi:MAG: hypothetical protein ACK47C_15965 [Paracoccaceae bacterium]
MGPGEIEALFTRGDRTYLFARWERPIVPVVFGVDDASLGVFKGAFEAVVTLAGHRMAETDPELGANLMVFAFRDWDELLEVRDLGRLVPELEGLVARLAAAGANQYRIFRFEASGAIKAAFVFLKMDESLASMEAETLALAQAVQTVVLWSDRAFDGTSPLARVGSRVILRPEIGTVIRAGYDPVLPVMARDPSHALRLAARVSTVDN